MDRIEEQQKTSMVWPSSNDRVPTQPTLISADRQSSLESLSDKPQEAGGSTFSWLSQLWQRFLFWLGIGGGYKPVRVGFNAQEFLKLSPISKLVNFREMMENKETPKDELLEAFSLLVDEDRSAILENLLGLGIEEEDRHHYKKPNQEQRHAQRFFERHPRHDNVFVAVRARILSQEIK